MVMFLNNERHSCDGGHEKKIYSLVTCINASKEVDTLNFFLSLVFISTQKSKRFKMFSTAMFTTVNSTQKRFLNILC
jgi:hypothetical protein